jgi:hypothetical protein
VGYRKLGCARVSWAALAGLGRSKEGKGEERNCFSHFSKENKQMNSNTGLNSTKQK